MFMLMIVDLGDAVADELYVPFDPISFRDDLSRSLSFFRGLPKRDNN